VCLLFQCARNVQKYFQEKAIQAQKAEKVQELRLKKIASFISKEIKTFWSNVEKVILIMVLNIFVTNTYVSTQGIEK
jgi:cell division protein FtsL